MAEIAERTPGFSGWQQEGWLTCCGGAELHEQFPQAIVAVKKHLKEDYDLSGADLQEFSTHSARATNPRPTSSAACMARST
jgi:uncharacterized protein CbrC (UPF0167 family)